MLHQGCSHYTASLRGKEGEAHKKEIRNCLLYAIGSAPRQRHAGSVDWRSLCGKEPVPSGKPASGHTLHVQLDHFPQFLPNGRAWFESRQERWIHFQRLSEEGQTSWRDDGAGHRLSTRAQSAESPSPSGRKEPGSSALKRLATRAPIEVRQIPREAENFHFVQGG
jgi:hypothetical protein